MSDDPTIAPAEVTPADKARKHLAVIVDGWPYVLDPIKVAGRGSRRGGIRPQTEAQVDDLLPPDAKIDTPRILAHWVHALIDEWPATLQTLEPDNAGHLQLVTATTIDCTDVRVMADLLSREADRLADWVEGASDWGGQFLLDLSDLASAVSRIAWPPKGDRITIGDCPACDRRVQVKAPRWNLVPQPTTCVASYAPYAWHHDRAKDVTCKCGISDTIEGWRHIMDGPEEPLTAEELVTAIWEGFGLRYATLTIRTWQRRGMIRVAEYAEDGRAKYDRVQVFAALIERERRRDAS